MTSIREDGRSPETLRSRDKKRRKKLREQLRSEGVSEPLIEKIIEQQRYDDLVARIGLDMARDVANYDAHRHDPDDTGYQPSTGDPLLRGPARVSGITAEVVKRRNTITQFQYNAKVNHATDDL